MTDASIEYNSEDWREIRARVDSIANAIFLIAGGALSLSISVILDKKASGIITTEVAHLAVTSWYCLLISVGLFLVLKVHLVFQAFMLQMNTEWVNRNLNYLNGFAWIIGLVGLLSFLVGLIQMVRASVQAVS